MSLAVLVLVAGSLRIPFVSGSSEFCCGRLPAVEKFPWLVPVPRLPVRVLGVGLV